MRKEIGLRKWTKKKEEKGKEEGIENKERKKRNNCASNKTFLSPSPLLFRGQKAMNPIAAAAPIFSNEEKGKEKEVGKREERREENSCKLSFPFSQFHFMKA